MWLLLWSFLSPTIFIYLIFIFCSLLLCPVPHIISICCVSFVGGLKRFNTQVKERKKKKNNKKKRFRYETVRQPRLIARIKEEIKMFANLLRARNLFFSWKSKVDDKYYIWLLRFWRFYEKINYIHASSWALPWPNLNLRCLPHFKVWRDFPQTTARVETTKKQTNSFSIYFKNVNDCKEEVFLYKEKNRSVTLLYICT